MKTKKAQVLQWFVGLWLLFWGLLVVGRLLELPLGQHRGIVWLLMLMGSLTV